MKVRALVTAVLLLWTLPPAAVAGAPGEHVDLELSVVELADEKAEMRQGLMFRRSLCDDCGMIFVFPEERVLSFWMKNTLIPLDIIFMDGEGRVVSVVKGMKPHQKSPTYKSKAPARFALEVNAGYVERKGIQAGQEVDLDSLWKKAVEFQWVNSDGVKDGVSP